MIDWLPFVVSRGPELWLRTGEHILLTGVSTLLAICLGIPLGMAAHHWPRWRGLITGSVGMVQTIPSLALLAILLALLNKIGTTPAVIALVLYALLPIVRNTLAGLANVPAPLREAADGIGMTRRQRLWLVELPLAAPVIVTGIRTAAVVGVGIATLSAFIGAGGLGQFINRGISLSNHHLILLGAVPAALLALTVDGAIAAAQWGLRRRRAHPHSARRERWLRCAALGAPLVIFALGALAVWQPNLFRSSATRAANADGAIVRIGAKNFTEQLILGEIMAQLIERKTNLRVERKFDLGGTMICHGALVSGEIDLYAEYTGTALTAVLQQEALAQPDATYQFVATAYAEQFNLRWLRPFGFNNTYAITLRARDAQRWQIQTLSDLIARAPELRAGWTSEFSERPDGYPGLRARYGLHFGTVRDLDTGLMYEALERGEVDAICAFATDGRIAAYQLQPLVDDRQFFPPYHAAPVVRAATLAAHPELEPLLELLHQKLPSATMQRLNYLVDGEKRSPAAVAREFLATEILAPAP
jgi:osmoprotectant transport system permease protein